ncbi:MAG: peptidoglycan editing factor PgeF [Alphaproteobacteria bacterium]|nr:peptidoglycan editing factor PgeF [Alphaproteobacteria bacterium]
MTAPISNLRPILVPNLTPLAEGDGRYVIKHGFFGRQGGVSQGVFDSLNCGYGSGDDLASVSENRRRVANYFGMAGDDLLTVYQYHSTEVVVITPENKWHAPDQAAKADAMVTKMRGVALGILTADCAPVLFADRVAGVIGAAHAGWRGALGGMTDQVIHAMCRAGAQLANIHAAIGPCIAAASYEVGAEFRQQFLAEDAANDRFFLASPTGKPDHYHFALAQYVTARLESAGIRSVSSVDADTAAQEEKYFSWRRTCWHKQTHYGRMIGVICLG